MKKILILLLCSVIGSLAAAHAGDIAGQWRAEFESPRGLQRYLFTFQNDGEKLTGKAAVEVGERKREAELTEVKFVGETVTFVEMLNFLGNEVRIRYTGNVGTNEIAFTREVGDFDATKFKATRGALVATNTPSLTQTNAAARGPQEPRIPRGRDIVLGPDDKAAFDEPPTGIIAFGMRSVSGAKRTRAPAPTSGPRNTYLTGSGMEYPSMRRVAVAPAPWTISGFPAP